MLNDNLFRKDLLNEKYLRALWIIACMMQFAPVLERFGYEIFPFLYIFPLLLANNSISKSSLYDLWLGSIIVVLLILNIRNNDAVVQLLQVLYVIYCVILFQGAPGNRKVIIAEASYVVLLVYASGLFMETVLPGGIPLIDNFRARGGVNKDELIMYTGGVRFLAPEPSYGASMVNGLFMICDNVLCVKNRRRAYILVIVCLFLLRSTGGIIYFIIYSVLSVRKNNMMLLLFVLLILCCFMLAFEDAFIWVYRINAIIKAFVDSPDIKTLVDVDQKFGSTRFTSLGGAIVSMTAGMSSDYVRAYSIFSIIIANMGAYGVVLLLGAVIFSICMDGLRVTIQRVLVLVMGAPLLIIPQKVSIPRK